MGNAISNHIKAAGGKVDECLAYSWGLLDRL